MTGSPRHTFPKAEKLKCRKQIDLLFREGKSFFAAPVKCYYLMGNKQLAIGKGQGAIGNEQGVMGNEQLAIGKNEGEMVNKDLAIGNWQPGFSENESLEIQHVKKEMEYVEIEEHDYRQTQGQEPETSNPEHQTSNPNNHKEQTINIQAGVSVSKRNFKHSVDRNRIKRLLREAYRLHKHTLLEKLAERQVTLEVFFVFTDRTLPTFELVEEKMKYCIRRLNKIVGGAS